MKELIVFVALIGNFEVTAYRSVPEQTDDSPFITSIGERVNEHGIAVSQDLLRSGIIKYGDTVYVEEIGFKVVNDTMHSRWNKRLDVWVPSYGDEKEFDRQFARRKLRVWVVKPHEMAATKIERRKHLDE